ncbi:P1 family peptidase [Pseudogemmobacter bohemicus]|uniref:P1 family peptidase n=1 Tax=Pseudogemmobacter bohemicus TaxID=2250708 RepID=UPI000DD3B607|nr:P1 family peptidase [Pseudogemmobacter bohemicus]
MRPGPRNLITDIAGFRVGNASDPGLHSGVTVLTADRPFTAAVHVMGGAPGTRETDLLAPDRLVSAVDALVLSGGSAFGLDACSGVMAGLRAMGRGFAVGDQRVPIVPGAILFDLLNGGDKSWPARDCSPYAGLGRRALDKAVADFQLGSSGAGTGAMTGTLKGGLGSASAVLPSGITVGALVAVNALGQVTAGDGPWFLAAPFEEGTEFGGLGPAPALPPPAAPLPMKRMGEATTIAIVATDATLTKAEAHRVAVAAHDGMARAICPAHSLIDGDLVFAAASGARALADPLTDLFQIGHAAAVCLSRAIARAVYLASPAPGDLQPCWAARFGT